MYAFHRYLLMLHSVVFKFNFEQAVDTKDSFKELHVLYLIEVKKFTGDTHQDDSSLAFK